MSEQENTGQKPALDELKDDDLNSQNTESMDGLASEQKDNLTGILDIPVTISLEVGRNLISIRNLLQLKRGSIVELNRISGEPLDVMVNGTLIAHGEVVVVNDKYGIQLTDVISQTERIKKLS